MNQISKMRRYQMGMVYRRDPPVAHLGRLREFYQCDFDIAGKSDPMLADVECLQVICRICQQLKLPPLLIKVNHRKLLEAVFVSCGIPQHQFHVVCTVVDTLDKSSWSHVATQLIQQRGCDAQAVDRLGNYIKQNGSVELLHQLQADTSLLSCSVGASEALTDLVTLHHYCCLLGIQNQIRFDLSLARGLDYYTGLIFEAVCMGDPQNPNSTASSPVGSVAAGGRYDNLVSSLCPKHHVPCVGLSIGLDRLLILLDRLTASSVKATDALIGTEVCVVSAEPVGFTDQRLQLANHLRNAGIKTAMATVCRPKFLEQMQYCEKHSIPFAVIVGTSEIAENKVKIRNMETREEVLVNVDDLIPTLLHTLRKSN